MFEDDSQLGRSVVDCFEDSSLVMGSVVNLFEDDGLAWEKCCGSVQIMWLG